MLTNLLGQSLEEAVNNNVVEFARKNIAEESIEKGLDIWTNSIEKVMSDERKKIWKKMFLAAGKLEQKDMVSMKKSLVDKLWWLWFGMFTKGDEDVIRSANSFFSNKEVENVAEFNDAIQRIKDVINQLTRELKAKQSERFNVAKTLNSKRLQEKTLLERAIRLGREPDANLTADLTRQIGDLENQIRDYDKEINNTNTTINTLKQQAKELKIKPKEIIPKVGTIENTPEYKKVQKQYQEKITKVVEKKKKEKTIDVDARQKKYEQIKDPNKKEITRELDLRRSKEEIRTKEAPLFMESSDFGRIYVRKRLDYIGDVYTGKTRENMEEVFNTLNQGYEKGDTKLPNPIQKYFERYPMTKAQGVKDLLQPDGTVATKEQIRGNRIIAEQDIPIPGSTQAIAGRRIKPKATANLSDYQVTQLIDSVEKMFVDDPKRKNKLLNNVNRIVSTELSAAYNMGRMHGMYRSGVRYVRWINDYEMRKTGRTCVACTARAMGRSSKAKLPDSLTGVYTLEEILTERQLAIPSHPHCLCWLRPLNDEENKLITNAAIPTTSQESLMTALAATGVGGAANINYGAEGEENRTSWYATAAKIGVTAVAMGMAYWYLRRSFVAKDAANLLRKKGVDIAERADERRLGDVKMPVTKEQLDASVALTDVINDPEPDIATKTKLVGQDALGQNVYRQVPMIDLSTLKPKERELVVNLSINPFAETIALETGALEQMRKITPDTPLEKIGEIDSALKLGRKIYVETNDEINITLLAEDTSPNLKQALERIAEENDRQIKRIDNFEKKLTSEYDDIANIKYNPQDLLETYQQLPEKYKKYLTRGLKTRSDGLERLYEEYRNKRVITRKDMMKIKNYVAQVNKKNRTTLEEIKKYLQENNLDDKFLGKLDKVDLPYNSDKITDSNLTPLGKMRDNLQFIGEGTNMLYEEIVTNKNKISPSYRIKLRDGLVSDPFITPKQMENIAQDNIPSMKDRTVVGEDLKKTVLKADQRVRTDALSKRRKAVKELSKTLSILDRAKGSDTTNIRYASVEILRKMNVDITGMNNAEIKRNVKELVKQLKEEIYKLQYVEFAQYQKKWATFGAPK
jgi:hypothetical protein